jgi:hypothetical protein
MNKISPFVFPGLPVNTFQTLTKESLLGRACIAYKVSPEQVLGVSRKAHIVLCRHAIAFTMQNLLKISSTETGRFLGNKDHSSMISAKRRFLNFLETDIEMRNKYRDFLLSLNADLLLDFNRKYIFEKREAVILKERNYILKPLPSNFGEQVFLGNIKKTS